MTIAGVHNVQILRGLSSNRSLLSSDRVTKVYFPGRLHKQSVFVWNTPVPAGEEA